MNAASGLRLSADRQAAKGCLWRREVIFLRAGLRWRLGLRSLLGETDAGARIHVADTWPYGSSRCSDGCPAVPTAIPSSSRNSVTA
jgi:hypothetical protein